MSLVNILHFVNDSRNDHRFCVVANTNVNGVVSASDKGASSVACDIQVS